MIKKYTVIILSIFISTIVYADGNLDLLLEELGLPKEIVLTKKAMAILSWSKLEKELYVQDAKKVCDRTVMLSERFKQESADRRKRLSDLKIDQEIPLDECESRFPEFNRMCLDKAREFYVYHYVSDSISQPLVQRVIIYLATACPSMRMLGYEVDAYNVLENYQKSK